ncbi:hypothetical protein E2C01_098775 [Portunus trituberculatus]|uniref:Uncharacterized protein n=1 Tax=Portunus trituberculatus TaxID=210409 RepID=A0A5B7K229_PORTR|nr:hypothetical protein [Portunus trituberculatus]
MVTLGYANIPSVSPVKRHFGRELSTMVMSTLQDAT